MRRLTPFFCITVSSSFATSSNVKPYCRPEHPPPVTNTRSFRSLLPSSSMRAFTLFAALSVKRSGSGIVAAVAMSFMKFSVGSRSSVGIARVRLELDDLLALLRALVHQLAHHDRADVDLDRSVCDISCDTRLGEEFDILRRAHRSCDGAVDHDMRDIDVAFHLRELRDHERTGLAARRLHVADDVPVDPEPAGERDVALDRRARADQAVDRAGFVG